MKKGVSICLVVILALLSGGCARHGSNWVEVKPKKEPVFRTASVIPYNEEALFGSSNYIFCGEIKSIQERKYELVDEASGEKFSPEYISFCEVEVHEEIFCNESTIITERQKANRGKTVIMVTPETSYSKSSESVELQTGQRYILFTEFVGSTKYPTEKGFAFETDADVAMRYGLYGVMPVADDKTIAFASIFPNAKSAQNITKASGLYFNEYIYADSVSMIKSIAKKYR